MSGKSLPCLRHKVQCILGNFAVNSTMTTNYPTSFFFVNSYNVGHPPKVNHHIFSSYFLLGIFCISSMQSLSLEESIEGGKSGPTSTLEIFLREIFTQTPLIVNAFNRSPLFYKFPYWCLLFISPL